MTDYFAQCLILTQEKLYLIDSQNKYTNASAPTPVPRIGKDDDDGKLDQIDEDEQEDEQEDDDIDIETTNISEILDFNYFKTLEGISGIPPFDNDLRSEDTKLNHKLYDLKGVEQINEPIDVVVKKYTTPEEYKAIMEEKDETKKMQKIYDIVIKDPNTISPLIRMNDWSELRPEYLTVSSDFELNLIGGIWSHNHYLRARRYHPFDWCSRCTDIRALQSEILTSSNNQQCDTDYRFMHNQILLLQSCGFHYPNMIHNSRTPTPIIAGIIHI